MAPKTKRVQLDHQVVAPGSDDRPQMQSAKAKKRKKTSRGK
ncbi:MAG TPA: hypothetical protein VGL76_07185 [Gaiellaceae bacterium]